MTNPAAELTHSAHELWGWCHDLQAKMAAGENEDAWESLTQVSALVELVQQQVAAVDDVLCQKAPDWEPDWLPPDA